MFCKKCGNKLEDGSKFCGKCGTPQMESPLIQCANLSKSDEKGHPNMVETNIAEHTAPHSYVFLQKLLFGTIYDVMRTEIVIDRSSIQVRQSKNGIGKNYIQNMQLSIALEDIISIELQSTKLIKVICVLTGVMSAMSGEWIVAVLFLFCLYDILKLKKFQICYRNGKLQIHDSVTDVEAIHRMALYLQQFNPAIRLEGWNG